MAQHDGNITNQLFPPTRADLNNALLALFTNSSGTSAPGTPVAWQWWADSTTGVLKLRNSTNDAWLDILDGTDGTILQPVTIETVPIGSMMAWPGLLAPDKWTLLDGDVLNIADYPGVYNVLGTRYNTGSETAGQFRKPDMRGRTVIGRDNMGGTAAGRVTQAVSGIDGLTLGATGGHQAVQTHQHAGSTPTLSNGSHDHADDFTGGMLDANSGTIYHYFSSSPSGGAGFSPIYFRGHNIEPANVTVTVTGVGETGSYGSGSGQNMPPGMVHNWIMYTGIVGATGDGGGGTAETTLGALETLHYALGDESTVIATAGTTISVRIPYDFVPYNVRIYLNSGCTTGTFEVSATVAGNALFSTNATIDATERTSKTAAVQPVLALTTLPDDGELIITIEDVGDGTAYGLKFILYGYQVL